MNITVEEMITNLQSDDVPVSDQIHMFIQLCQDKPLMDSLKKQAMLMQLEMATADPVYDFAYGVLKLAKPHLFEKEMRDDR